MADARVNSIDELEVSRKTLIRLSENINQFFKEMSREVVNMQNNWDDTKYIESTFWFDISIPVFIILILVTLMSLGNLALKIMLMRGERKLIEEGEAQT